MNVSKKDNCSISIGWFFNTLLSMCDDMDRVNALAAQFSGQIVSANTVKVVAPVAKVSAQTDTISYEILTSLKSSLKRQIV